MKPYNCFKAMAFRFDPERVHDLSIQLFNKAPYSSKLFSPFKSDKKYQIKTKHMNWDFPVGLAAGFDKNARALEFLSSLGFGAIEFGTVTPKAQIGNPRPRIKRFPEDDSLLNSMGFPNEGMEKVFINLANSSLRENCTMGANLGKNKDTPLDKTPEDYANLYEKFAPHVGYLVINISSPNTPGLRALQSKEGFKVIAQEVSKKRAKTFRPLYLKIAPELAKSDLEDLVDIAQEFNFSGIIATNTSVSHNRGPGGLSGELIKEQARQARLGVLDITKTLDDFSVIGAGGISNFNDALEFWQAGGDMVQIYTSFIYQGPQILKDFKNGIDDLLKKTGASSLQQWKDSL